MSLQGLERIAAISKGKIIEVGQIITDRLSPPVPTIDRTAVAEACGQANFLETVLGTDVNQLLTKALETKSINKIIEIFGLQRPLLNQGTPLKKNTPAAADSNKYRMDGGSFVAPSTAAETFDAKTALYQGSWGKFDKLLEDKKTKAGYREAYFCKMGEHKPNETVRLEITVSATEMVIVKYYFVVEGKDELKKYKQIFHLGHKNGIAQPISDAEPYMVSQPRPVTGETESGTGYSFLYKLAWLLTEYDQEFTKLQGEIVRKSDFFAKAGERFEMVRRHREAYLLDGATLGGESVRTGFGGYYVGQVNAEGQSLAADEIVIAMANRGVELVKSIKEHCAFQQISYEEVMLPTLRRNWMEVGNKRDVLTALRILDSHFVKLIQELRAKGEKNPLYQQYRAQTQAVVNTIATKKLVRDGEGNWQIEELVGTPASIEPRPIDHILTDPQKEGLKLMMEIGMAGNRLIRATQEIANRQPIATAGTVYQA